jgi:hypothetical protein
MIWHRSIPVDGSCGPRPVLAQHRLDWTEAAVLLGRPGPGGPDPHLLPAPPTCSRREIEQTDSISANRPGRATPAAASPAF